MVDVRLSGISVVITKMAGLQNSKFWFKKLLQELELFYAMFQVIILKCDVSILKICILKNTYGLFVQLLIIVI